MISQDDEISLGGGRKSNIYGNPGVNNTQQNISGILSSTSLVGAISNNNDEGGSPFIHH